MLKTCRLIFSKICATNRRLLINWVIYSVCTMLFGTIWVLIPKEISQAVEQGSLEDMVLGAGAIGVIASAALFLKTVLYNNAWMQMNNVRYSILLDLIGYSIDVPYHKTLDSDYLSELDKTRNAAMNPNMGIGSVMGSLYKLLGVILTSCGLLWILTKLSVLFVLFILGTIVLAFVCNTYANKEEKREWERRSDLDRKHEKIYDVMMDEAYAKDMRLFSLHHLLRKYGKGYSAEIKGISSDARRKKLKYQIAVLAVEMLRDAVVYIWIAASTIAGNISIGSFLTYTLSVFSLSQSVQSILTQCSGISKEISRFSGFWNIKREADWVREGASSKGVAVPSGELGIEFEHVSFTYPDADRPTIDNLSLRIEPGERIALVGVNGAGKSTFMKLLCRLYMPQSGRILLNGTDIQTIPASFFYPLLCVIFQNGAVLPHTVCDNITLSEVKREEQYRQAAVLSGFSAVERKLPQGEDTFLSHTLSEDGVELSGGEKQKLLLARALYRKGKLFLLDEPAGAMDAIAEELLYRSYGDITKGATSIIVSHQLSFIGFCNRIILLENGRIAECGTHEELMDMRGAYYEMHAAQRKQYEEAE